MWALWTPTPQTPPHNPSCRLQLQIKSVTLHCAVREQSPWWELHREKLAKEQQFCLWWAKLVTIYNSGALWDPGREWGWWDLSSQLQYQPVSSLHHLHNFVCKERCVVLNVPKVATWANNDAITVAPVSKLSKNILFSTTTMYRRHAWLRAWSRNKTPAPDGKGGCFPSNDTFLRYAGNYDEHVSFIYDNTEGLSR